MLNTATTVMAHPGTETYVNRWYMSKMHALTIQMVTHCICSTTKTILEP